jgi:hypothetical protein
VILCNFVEFDRPGRRNSTEFASGARRPSLAVW